MTPSEIRSTALTIADACDYELTFQEIIRFLPSATVAEFIEHMREAADIEDVLA